MKVCVIAPLNSVHTQRWLTEINKWGITIQLLASGQHINDWAKPYNPHSLPPHFPGHIPKNIWRFANLTHSHSYILAAYWLWGAYKLKKLISQWQPDLIHIHYLDHIPLYALLTGFHPIVATPWGSDLLLQPDQYNRPQQALFRWALHNIDHMTCNSTKLQQAAIHWGTPPDRIQPQQWGVDLNHFHPHYDTTTFRQQHHIPSDALVILHPRTLKPLYCPDAILRAFAQIHGRHPHAILLQLGTHCCPEELTQLKKLAQQLGIHNNVRWLGFLTEDQLPFLFNTAHITVSLATSDSLPTSLLEAMACGSLPIFSQLGGIPDWITHQHNGLLVIPGNANHLAQAIFDALEQPPSWWQQAQQHNQTLIQTKANRTKEFDKLIDIYHQFIKPTLS